MSVVFDPSAGDHRRVARHHGSRDGRGGGAGHEHRQRRTRLKKGVGKNRPVTRVNWTSKKAKFWRIAWSAMSRS